MCIVRTGAYAGEQSRRPTYFQPAIIAAKPVASTPSGSTPRQAPEAPRRARRYSLTAWINATATKPSPIHDTAVTFSSEAGGGTIFLVIARAVSTPPGIRAHPLPETAIAPITASTRNLPA